MNRSKVVIRDAAKFTISGYISTVCNFVSATIVRKILDPFFMGIYTELMLIFEYSKYGNLGMFDSLDRQIPYYNGKKEFEKVEEMKNVGISFSLIASVIMALALIIFPCIFKSRFSPLFSLGLKVTAILVIVQSMSTFYVTIIRGHHLFGPLSRYVVLVGVLDIIFKAMLGIKFGVIGILWATIITLAFGTFYLFRRSTITFRISLKMPIKTVKALLGIGFPLLLASFTFMVLRSIDRIMIIALLTKEALGFYSIAIMVHSFIFQLPNLIYTVLFPRFYEAFGGSGDLKELKGFLEKPTLVFAYLFPILIGMTVIILPIFIKYVLPKYTDGITAAYILLFGTFFISITNMSGYLLVALKKQNSLVLIGTVCVLICAALNFIFVKFFNLGINGIALGTSLAYFLYSLFLIGYAMRQYVGSLYDRLRFFRDIYLPILWVLLIFYAFGFVFHYNFKNLNSDILAASLQMLVFLVLTSPLLFYANKKTEFYTRIKNAGLNR